MGLKTKRYFTLPLVARKMILVLLATLLFLTSINISVFASSSNNNGTSEIEETKDIDPSSIPISFEDTSKRDTYTKHFRKLDGSYEVSVYDEAVHYMKENKWKQIDNRLTLNEETNESIIQMIGLIYLQIHRLKPIQQVGQEMACIEVALVQVRYIKIS